MICLDWIVFFIIIIIKFFIIKQIIRWKYQRGIAIRFERDLRLYFVCIQIPWKITVSD